MGEEGWGSEEEPEEEAEMDMPVSKGVEQGRNLLQLCYIRSVKAEHWISNNTGDHNRPSQ